MKLLLRFTIFLILLFGSPQVNSVVHAITVCQVELETTQPKKSSERWKKRLSKYSRKVRDKEKTPKTIFFSGLAIIGASGVFTLLGYHLINNGFRDPLLGVLLIITGAVGIIFGGVISLVGGILWIIERFN